MTVRQKFESLLLNYGMSQDVAINIMAYAQPILDSEADTAGRAKIGWNDLQFAARVTP